MNRVKLKGQSARAKSAFLQGLVDTEGKIVVIVGISKNSGKTTLLNWLTDKLKDYQVGVLTTGRDGEEVDLVENTPKPKVKLYPNTLFCCRTREIDKHSPFLTIVEKLPYKASGETLWLVKTDSTVEVEITGPPTVSTQIEIAKRMAEYGVDLVLIDGSIDRKAVSTSSMVGSLVVVGGPSFGNLTEIEREFKRIYNLSKIPVIDESVSTFQINDLANIALLSRDTEKRYEFEFRTLLGHEKQLAKQLNELDFEDSMLYIPTSIMERSLLTLRSNTTNFDNLPLLTKHPFNLYLSDASLSKLLNQKKLFALNSFNVSAFAVNSFDPQGNHLDSEILREQLRRTLSVPVIDVFEAQLPN
ncbi:MAG: hypothetical protein WC327_07625 [Candidatus Cloacimonadia bacterium]